MKERTENEEEILIEPWTKHISLETGDKFMSVASV